MCAALWRCVASTRLAFELVDSDIRLALSTQFGGAALAARLATLGYPGSGAVQFMTNAIDATTIGVDITGGRKLGGFGSR